MEEPTSLVIDDRVMRSFIPAKCAAGSFSVSCIDYDATGAHLITSSVGSLSVYDLTDGERQKKVTCQKYGTDLVKWSHHPDTVLYSGNSGTLRYLSLYDNQHIRYFEGHAESLCSLDINPSNDTILTGSLDGTVRCWDVSTPSCLALLNCDKTVNPRPLIAFDPSGVMFALVSSPWVRMYSLKQLEGGPFLEVSLEESLREVSAHKCSGRFSPTFTSCKFDLNGQYLCIATNQGLTLVIDSFYGRLESVLGDFEINMPYSTEACFTPDGKYVMRGGTDGAIRCWNRKTAALVKTWEHNHTSSVRCLKFNPIMLNFTSTCTNINMWLPKLPSKRESHSRNPHPPIQQ